MEAIKLKEYISEKGLFIENEKIKKFRNMNVEIIILPLDEKTGTKSFLNFAGKLNSEEGEIMLNSVEECRKIDLASWE